MSKHLYSDCLKCPYFASVGKISYYKDKANEYQKSYGSAIEILAEKNQEIAQKDEALRVAREALKEIKGRSEIAKAECDACFENYYEAKEVITTIDKALGGTP